MEDIYADMPVLERETYDDMPALEREANKDGREEQNNDVCTY